MASNVLTVIAGAGPAGLTLGCLLEFYHQPFVIIDSCDERDRLSKATGLHRNSLRLFEKIGLANIIAQLAIELNANNVIANGKLQSRTLFEQGEKNYDRNLCLDQSSLEDVLRSRITAEHILYGRKLIQFRQNPDCILIQIQNTKTLEIEELKAKFLIGADGAASFVRKTLGFTFEGETTPLTSFTFDASSSYSSKNEMSMYGIGDERLVIVPLPGEKCKFSGKILEINLLEDRSIEATAEIQETIRKIVHDRSGIELKGDPTGLSFYKTASRIASAFRGDNIFLVGDAAHIFFPAGGYGLNVAVEDAFHLAWRIALFFSGLFPYAAFDSFARERRANAIAIRNDAMQKKATLDEPLSHQGTEKEEQVYNQSLVFSNEIVSERLETIIPQTLGERIKRKTQALFDWIHQNKGFSLIAYTTSESVFTLLKDKCVCLNGKSPIPFSLVHVCLSQCSLPSESASCFIMEQEDETFRKYSECVISIRPDNFGSVTSLQRVAQSIDPFVTSTE